MHIHYYPISVDDEDYRNGVSTWLLDEHAQQVINGHCKRFYQEGLFHDISIVSKNDEEFHSWSKSIKEEYNLHLMRLIKMKIFEPWIDYLDTELEEYYDDNREKFVSYSKYYH